MPTFDSAASSTTCPPECKDCALRVREAFVPIDGTQLNYIAGLRSGAATFEAGRDIIPEQQKIGALYTLYSGWAFRYKSLSDGRRQILNFLLPGDFIGLQEQFADGPSHGVQALTDVTLCKFPRDQLWSLFRDYPEIAYDVTWLASREEGHVDEHLLTAGKRNANERVAMLLLHLYRRAERVGMSSDGSVVFPLNQQHIADALGLSLVHTNRTLRRLAALGLHSIQDGRLSVLNPKALQRIADYYFRPLRRVPLI